MKRFIITTIIFVSLFTGQCTVYASEYSDVPDTFWGAKAIQAMSDSGIMKGYPDGTFKPSELITRAEFVKIADIVGTGRDVGNSSTGAWYLNYWHDSADRGYNTYSLLVIQGWDTFKVSRYQAADVLSGMVGETTFDKSKMMQLQRTMNHGNYSTGTCEANAYSLGLMTPTSNGDFRGGDDITRAEAAEIMYRYLNKEERVTVDVDSLIAGLIKRPVYQTASLLNVDALKSFIMEEGNDNDLTVTDTYELYSAKEMNIQAVCNIRTHEQMEYVKGYFSGMVYLIKDGLPISWSAGSGIDYATGDTRQFDSVEDILSADYFVDVPFNDTVPYGDVIHVTPNPFKK